MEIYTPTLCGETAKDGAPEQLWLVERGQRLRFTLPPFAVRLQRMGHPMEMAADARTGNGKCRVRRDLHSHPLR
jgi:hypothetical protein